jgi:dTDP-4-amino-4,6-dideoxygalactose transaminase
MDRIQDLPGIHLRPSRDPEGDLGWTIAVLLPDRKTRNRFVAAMNAENVEMSAPSGSIPLPREPYIANKAAPHPAWPSFNSPRGREIQYGAQCCPQTIAIFDRAAQLTIGPKYTESDLKDIVAAITKVYRAV